MNKTVIVSILCLLVSIVSFGQDTESKKVDLKGFKRLYQINDSIYRSEQPSRSDFKLLETYGINTILNLRRLRNDSKKARHTNLQLVHLPMRTGKLEEKDIVNALKAIQLSQKPTLIHCWHGSDRTGVVVAAYRIVFEDWSKEKAIAEFRKEAFGYHEKMYPNLLKILKELNVKEIKLELGLE